MSLETIQKAITRLEQLQADSTQGEWDTTPLWYGVDVETEQGYLVAASIDIENAELIVALHRTIPALLEMFKSEVEWLEEGNNAAIVESSTVFAATPELALARAILGETE